MRTLLILLLFLRLAMALPVGSGIALAHETLSRWANRAAFALVDLPDKGNHFAAR